MLTRPSTVAISPMWPIASLALIVSAHAGPVPTIKARASAAFFMAKEPDLGELSYHTGWLLGMVFRRHPPGMGICYTGLARGGSAHARGYYGGSFDDPCAAGRGCRRLPLQ